MFINKAKAAITAAVVPQRVLMFHVRQLLVGVLGIAALLWASSPHAEVRIESHRWQNICRLIIVSESRHGTRTLHDGPARSGFRKSVKGPVTVCISRSHIPDQCSSRLTRWACKTNVKANRTILFNVQ
jgi:hypothetical protein